MSRMLIQQVLRSATLALAVGLVASCASLPQPHDDGALQREAIAGTQNPVPAPLPLNSGSASRGTAATTELSHGSGQFIRPGALIAPRPAAGGNGAVTFNFENQPVQAVVKAILGDLLKQNYTIVPGVQGNISFATAEPVDASQALPILETLLSWTGNALVHRDGGYVVMPQKDAVAGNLVPSLGASAPAGGLQARLFPLHYISASEMQKLIKPFARPDATLLVDPARNLLVMSGTPQELANYQSMVRTFDVDWLRGMSVGVFNLQYANVGELMPKLDAMFGEHGNTPLAGMLRFIPIERTNALVVISTQSDYLQEVGDWIARIDRGGGNEPQLFVYDVRNIKASDLARYLAQIYTNGAGSGGGDSGGQVGPGLAGATLGSAENAGATSMGSTAGSFGNPADASRGGGQVNANAGGGFGASGGGRDGGAAAGGSFGSGSAGFGSYPAAGGGSSAASEPQYSSSDGSVRISSVDGSNQLLVRARPSQWEEIKGAIGKLDNVPLQVQIETRILEVNLTGEFQFGVQWYLEGLTGSTTDSSGNIIPGQPYRHRQLGLGQGGNAFRGEPFFYSFLNSDLQVAVRAMETSGNTKTLSAPSMVVMNNQVASIAVGNQIPINQTSVNTGIGTTTSYSQVSYLNTGVILNVQPRINPGGLVYMNISQEVSQADRSVPLVNGNPAISQRKLATQVAVQSGQTVLLGGLIEQAEGNTDTGIPGLNRVPVLGRLFGNTSRSRNRTELIVLITPRVIRGGADAKQITDDYQSKFESLAPLRAPARADSKP
ncbi:MULTISPECIES: type II secretion system secretin GspD [Rhodanobacter]|uniref:type II secretion system secretin GspD n=1 Tax=Rhodanobacter TaxID=75309 RepID=UPI0002D2EFA4|nr:MULTISPECIES: type II secretion system secretin GspD [Rhodanobacter]KZC19594.1 type II secretion system protein GspD [Rhodanobacter denitrificans]UJJ50856.1 type II secretion system secretin GspD [Rhodanobacter denitrificans]UJM90815.1 type II secretion system secretin GspD [Rhodanobacter denitrificans]UJM93571.1 type II secretion system secretin GspD [Rhodanobacter denitrificans]UJM97102.1 type II secretion system secretin GspD [Rhodanobacter denitrificans]